MSKENKSKKVECPHCLADMEITDIHCHKGQVTVTYYCYNCFHIEEEVFDSAVEI